MGIEDGQLILVKPHIFSAKARAGVATEFYFDLRRYPDKWKPGINLEIEPRQECSPEADGLDNTASRKNGGRR